MGSLLVEKVLSIAAKEVGTTEVGGNDLGPRITEYQAAVNIPPGSPWCAAFVHWCLKQAHVPVEPATGDTWAIREWAKEHEIYYNDGSPAQRGDIVLFLDADGNPEHTGYVTDDNGDGTFSTIEGNTHSLDSGVKGVWRKRHYYGSSAFVRWIKLCKE